MLELHARVEGIPEETARVAHAIFVKGNPYLTIRDQLGVVYQDEEFAELFARRGRPAIAPARLALVTVMQFAEDLTDRQAADAVRSRIDWKYILGLDLTDTGFDHTVLGDFRTRLIEGAQEYQLLDRLLERFQTLGLLAKQTTQRTDSTHVLGAIRQVNRLELAGETMRHLLNTLATVAPQWVQAQIPPDWYDRYTSRFEATRLPSEPATRTQLAEQIGKDGFMVLELLYASDTPAYLRELPVVETVRHVWIQQFYLDQDVMRWRPTEWLPKGQHLIESPFDLTARYSVKRSTEWVGYKVHLTECCEPTSAHFITHVTTTLATTADMEQIQPIHQALLTKGIAPRRHLVDCGYTDGEELVRAAAHGITLYGPFRPDTSWQAQTPNAFSIGDFEIDWQQRQARCPTGHRAIGWKESKNHRGRDVVVIRFAKATCRVCPLRARCTHHATEPRSLKLRPQPIHEALLLARHRQTTPEFRQHYAKRAGIEGTISQGVIAFGLRRTRYRSLAKTKLQHIATAAAMNLARFFAWHQHRPFALTRISPFAKLKIA